MTVKCITAIFLLAVFFLLESLSDFHRFRNVVLSTNTLENVFIIWAISVILKWLERDCWLDNIEFLVVDNC